MEYIVVQAGGMGTRLKHLTKNKPKALVPVENLPMLFHLFRKYPDKKFIIIADYHRRILRDYLNAFADVDFRVIDANGTGTCAGVKEAVSLLPDNKPFMLVWSDLILPDSFTLPEEYGKPGGKPEEDYVGLSVTFPCRWKYENGIFSEERSKEYGVAGFFLFTDKSKLEPVPENGELVRWMSERKFSANTISLAGTREYGLLEEYQALEKEKCRPFNRITTEGDILVKEAINEQGRTLARRECAWYKKAEEYGVKCIPRIDSFEPLKMERIHGENIYEADLTLTEKRKILERLVSALDDLHKKERISPDVRSIKEAYFTKTMDRLGKVEHLVPYANEPRIKINGRNCRNVFHHKDKLERMLDGLSCDHFSFIHGDCTFSNLMVRDDGTPVFIDPRGYFGFTELFGDERYDWAKLYYSLAGNYDRFNLKEFSLEIGGDRGSKGDTAKDLPEGEVELDIVSNGWETLEDDFFLLTGTSPDEIKLIHAVIWLSLTTYAWEDVDSICGAFYNGLYYLEEVL